MNNLFYDNQDNLTKAKIEIYKLYIENYLVKLLMTFGQCFIGDLFCGPGRNGKEDGSPITLLNSANYILTTPKLNNPEIFILFNDLNKKHVLNLKSILHEIKINKQIKILGIEDEEFKQILPKIIQVFTDVNIPKFFFLDPFTYSDITMDHLKELMNLRHSEILLFLPVFHSYRFAGDNKLSLDHKTRKFIEEFTDKGINDYKNVDEFMNSIKVRLKHRLDLDFVRPILLDGGARKNALFLLTKSQKGMMLMNKIAFKKSEDGSGINIKHQNSQTLFGINETDTFKKFEKKLINKIKNEKNITNYNIINFTIAENFLSKHAKMILMKLKKNNKIKISDLKGKEINQFYIAENPKGTSKFQYNE